MCLCIRVICVSVYVYMSVCLCVDLCIVCVCVCLCGYVSMYASGTVFVWVCGCVCVYVLLCVYVFVSLWVCLCASCVSRCVCGVCVGMSVSVTVCGSVVSLRECPAPEAKLCEPYWTVWKGVLFIFMLCIVCRALLIACYAYLNSYFNNVCWIIFKKLFDHWRSVNLFPYELVILYKVHS